MNKVYAMIAILTFGAPLAAAEPAAPQLPFIDAAMVRSLMPEKVAINISAAFPKAQRASMETEKIVPLVSKDSGLTQRASAPDTAAAREIAAIAKSPDSPFGAIDSGNLGLSAYRLTPEAANMTVRLVRKAFPGISLGNRPYAAAGPQLILVVTSEDEASVYMYEQGSSNGRLSRLADFNTADAVDAFYSDPQLAAFASGYDRYDWPGVLQGLAGKGRGIALPLGAGSARPYWWNN